MNERNRKPEITFFAGPNGSGKSTITDLIRPPYKYINADEIKKILDCSDIEAAKLATARRESYLEKSENFAFETVLSTDRNLKLLQRAKAAGYFIRGFYVITADPMINVERVKMRVYTGGHDVPTEKIMERYDKSLALLSCVVECCDICHIYDNTDFPFRIFKKRKEAAYYHENEDWKLEDIQLLTGIENLQAKNLNEKSLY
ncbi:zeta toxin family protein [Anaerovorax odorimutans]|uniref:Zeta toxin family protein n=1 Tax=Anaerovorax odorimutans TaxID=109327 RepID=A0ABT1RMY7_9FIRM|nr:zeta toxin family protein [Anaerovorax odorimutans]